MLNVNDIISYFYLFLALCGFVTLTLALVNIYTKSYRPRNATIFIVIIVILFVINTVLAFNSLRIFLNNFSVGNFPGSSPSDSIPASSSGSIRF